VGAYLGGGLHPLHGDLSGGGQHQHLQSRQLRLHNRLFHMKYDIQYLLTVL
jgi:hypothetical protein